MNEEHNSTCPNCGYCKHCGRSNQQPYVFFPTLFPQIQTSPTNPWNNPTITFKSETTEVK